MDYYDFHEMNEVASEGAIHIESYLKSLPSTVSVTNVEQDPVYQDLDIDLLAVVKEGDAQKTISIEIKVDRYFSKSKNYFFENISNDNTGSPGCLLKSQADFIFYYFLNQEVHIFRTTDVQRWMALNQTKFKRGIAKNKHYNTQGMLVPRDLFSKDVTVWVRKITKVTQPQKT